MLRRWWNSTVNHESDEIPTTNSQERENVNRNVRSAENDQRVPGTVWNWFSGIFKTNSESSTQENGAGNQTVNADSWLAAEEEVNHNEYVNLAKSIAEPIPSLTPRKKSMNKKGLYRRKGQKSRTMNNECSSRALPKAEVRNAKNFEANDYSERATQYENLRNVCDPTTEMNDKNGALPNANAFNQPKSGTYENLAALCKETTVDCTEVTSDVDDVDVRNNREAAREEMKIPNVVLPMRIAPDPSLTNVNQTNLNNPAGNPLQSSLPMVLAPNPSNTIVGQPKPPVLPIVLPVQCACPVAAALQIPTKPAGIMKQDVQQPEAVMKHASAQKYIYKVVQYEPVAAPPKANPIPVPAKTVTPLQRPKGVFYTKELQMTSNGRVIPRYTPIIPKTLSVTVPLKALLRADTPLTKPVAVCGTKPAQVPFKGTGAPQLGQPTASAVRGSSKPELVLLANPIVVPPIRPVIKIIEKPSPLANAKPSAAPANGLNAVLKPGMNRVAVPVVKREAEACPALVVRPVAATAVKPTDKLADKPALVPVKPVAVPAVNPRTVPQCERADNPPPPPRVMQLKPHMYDVVMYKHSDGTAVPRYIPKVRNG